MMSMFNLDEVKKMVKSLKPKFDNIVHLIRERNEIGRRRNQLLANMLRELEHDGEGGEYDDEEK